MLTGSPTQIATSVKTLVELTGLIDGAYLDGEIAHVADLDLYYRISRHALSGIPTTSHNGFWTFYSAGVANLQGDGPPGLRPVVVGVVYVDRLTGDLYAGVVNPLPAWVLVASGGGGSNASALQGFAISTTPPTDGQGLVYSALLGMYVPSVLPATLRAGFSYSSGSPLVLRPLAAGATVISAQVRIVTGFDDPATTLELGTLSTPGAIFSPGEIFAPLQGVYSNPTPFTNPVADQLILTLSPGASTQGAGLVTLLILPP